MSKLGEVCIHGLLKRQCETCEIADERDRLKAELEQVKQKCKVLGDAWNKSLAETSGHREAERDTFRGLLEIEKNESNAWKGKCEKMREAVIVLHSRDAANKKLPHVLCFYCDLIAQFDEKGKL